jgi:hypothetical protein
MRDHQTRMSLCLSGHARCAGQPLGIAETEHNMGAHEMDDSEAPQTVDAVLARDSNQQRPSFGQCLADCALDHYGLSGLLGRGGVGAASIPFPKSWIGAPTVLGAGPNTNLLSTFGHSFPSLNPWRQGTWHASPVWYLGSRHAWRRSRAAGLRCRFYRAVHLWMPEFRPARAINPCPTSQRSKKKCSRCCGR